MSVQSRQAFAAQMAPRVVRVRRRIPPAVSARPVFEPSAYGWLLAPGRVLTVERLVTGWPSEDEDVIEVQVADGPWRAAAPGMVKVEQGLVILDVAKPESKPGSSKATSVDTTTLTTLEPGARRWAVVLDGSGGAPALVPVGIVAQAPKPYQFYRWSPGVMLPSGTPVVDRDGQLATLVSAPLWGLHDKPGEALYPTSAMKAMLEGAALWLPSTP
ncbi:MAG: hypothetical protein ACE366_06545 [Bradymonadia bacterium]